GGRHALASVHRFVVPLVLFLLVSFVRFSHTHRRCIRRAVRPGVSDRARGSGESSDAPLLFIAEPRVRVSGLRRQFRQTKGPSMRTRFRSLCIALGLAVASASVMWAAPPPVEIDSASADTSS